MTVYTDVFGGDVVPPSQSDLNVISITADTTMYWPEAYSGTGISAADIIEVTSDAARTITFPPANSVGKGAGFVISNKGAYVLTVLDGAAGALTTVGVGVAKYFYVEVNTTVAGTWSVLTWGAGTSAADANTLAGAGHTVVSGQLASSMDTVESASSATITSSHRAKLIVATGGTTTFTLSEATTLGTDFYCTFKNSGTGTLTIATTSSQLIDDATSFNLQPDESATVVRDNTSFYSFGIGRSTIFAFTQLNKTVSGATLTITASEAANKMLNFVGSPGANCTVTLPSSASIYYVYNNLTTAYSLIFKTSSGAVTTTVSQGLRGILFCDGLDVVSAQSPAATAAVTFVDGSATSPSVTFSSGTNGLYNAVGYVGVTVAGASVGTFTAAGGWTGSVSGISPTILGYLSTISSDIQVQVAGKQAIDADVTALAALSGTGMLSHTGAGAWAERTITAGAGITVTNGNGVLANPTIEVTASTYQPLDAQLTTLAGITAQQATDLAAVSTFIGTLLNDADAATARATLGVADLIASATTATPDNAADYFLFEDATDNTQKKALLSTLGGITTGTAVATTSGVAADFTGIPVGTKRITVALNGVSTNGSSVLLVQLGTGGAPTTTGYNSFGEGMSGASMTAYQFTTGFAITEAYSAGRTFYGQLIFTHMGSNIWAMSGAGCQIGLANGGSTCGGAVTLAGALNFLRLTSVSADTFDAGSVNILYE